ncbi:hypothetical protein ABPG72_014390 [Tetrahymena utriculariae]
MYSSSTIDLVRDYQECNHINIQNLLTKKSAAQTAQTGQTHNIHYHHNNNNNNHHHYLQKLLRKNSNSSSQSDKSNSPTKEFDLKSCASYLSEKLYSHLDYVSWREEKNSFLKKIRSSFDEFFDSVNENLERIIKQQETQSLFEKHKATIKIISQKGNTAQEDDLNFFKNQCLSGKLEKELQILQQSKSLKQNILANFYADITRSIENLKKTDLVLLEKLKKPDSIIAHELRTEPTFENSNSFCLSSPAKLKLKSLEIPLSQKNGSRQSSIDSQKSLNSNISDSINLRLSQQMMESPFNSPPKTKAPKARSNFRNLTASPCLTPVAPSSDSIQLGFQNSTQLQSQSSSFNQSSHCFQGKKIYNFEFSLEETQSVLLKNENELILIGEQIKIWDNKERKITYEKKIEQIHELNGKKYSIGWGQFSVLDNKHVVIGNNNTKQIFLFSINPFRLIKVLEEDSHHSTHHNYLQNSLESISPLTSPPPSCGQRQDKNNFNLYPTANQNVSLNQIANQQNSNSQLSFDSVISDILLQQESQNLVLNQQNSEIDADNNKRTNRQYRHFIKIDENKMACLCSHNKIQIWNIKTHQLIHTMKAGSSQQKLNRIIKINNSTIASHCESDNKIRLWNIQTGKQQRKSIQLPTKMIQNMWKFRNCLYIVSFKNTIFVYNLNSLKLIKYLQLPFQIVLSKQLSEDYIIGVQNYNEVFILSLKDFTFKKVIKMEFQITDIIIFNSRVFATFNICSESRKGKIEYLQ